MPLAPRPVWLGSAAAVALATAAALLVILIGDPGERDARMVGTLVAALLCGGAALAALALLERPGLAVPGATVLVGAVVTFLLFTLGVWKAGYEGEGLDDWFKLVPIALAWSTTLLIGASTLFLLGGARRPSALVAVVAATWAAVVTGIVWAEADSAGWTKLVVALAILTVGSFLFAPLWRRVRTAA